MSSNETLGLLPGQSAPLATITSLDQGGVVVIATSLGLAFALVATVLRIYMQLDFRRRLSQDDFTAVAAFVSRTMAVSNKLLTVGRCSRWLKPVLSSLQ